MRQALINLIEAVKAYHWYIADPINLSIALANTVVERKLEDQYANALESLLAVIPSETEDRDWMSEKLKDAISAAEAECALNDINSLANAIEVCE